MLSLAHSLLRCAVCRLVDMLYNFLSANRLSLGGALDGIIAAKRMEMSKSGKETCKGERGGGRHLWAARVGMSPTRDTNLVRP